MSIDLLTTTDNTGITIDGTTNTVTLDSLAHGQFYTMNVQQFVEGPSEMIVDVVAGWNMFGLSRNGVLTDDSSLVISGTIYWFNGTGYGSSADPNSLIANRGYWVKCSGPGTIVLDLTE